MSKPAYLATFVLGTVIGAAATWFFVKKKYEKIADEEIASVKEVFAKREASSSESSIDISVEDFGRDEDEPDMMSYASKLSETGYTNYSNLEMSFPEVESVKVESVEEKMMNAERPYVISPEEFGDMDDYSCISLTYYADHILTDDFDELVEDVDYVVGKDSLNHFGEYESDSVFVRNDRLKADYEILLDHRKFSDVVKHKPRMEGLYEE